MSLLNVEQRACDVLIIGGGGAGCLAALEAATNEPLRVLLVSGGPIGMSGLTPTANGGTAAEGSEEELFSSMIRAGRYLNDQDICWFLTHSIKDSIRRLKDFGINVTPLRARSVVVHGVEMLKRLRKLICSKSNIELLEDVIITRLATSENRVIGAVGLRVTNGMMLAITAKCVVLATGGSTGELYPYSSNNPFGISTGAAGLGHIMALRAGAELVDMEMIQFVPLPSNIQALNIRYFPEFWEGPYLNKYGEIVEKQPSRFDAASYSPELVRALFREIKAGRGPIYIDQRNLSSVEKAVPGVGIGPWKRRREFMKRLEISPSDLKFEIVIGSHFSMGGVKVNKRTETSVFGLLATGEIMGCVHGACRLPGFSFSQMIVFGLEAGRRAAELAKNGTETPAIPLELIENEAEFLSGFRNSKKHPVEVSKIKKWLKETMEKYVFVERNKIGLAKALKEIDEIQETLNRVQVHDSNCFNIEWKEAIELSFTTELARVVTLSALFREETRGFHFRSDFPEEDNSRWLRHTVCQLRTGGIALLTSPVDLSHINPGGMDGR